jgi:hypothetical protein
VAEYYFKKAMAINNVSPALHCYVAMALHAQRKSTLLFSFALLFYRFIELLHSLSII